MNRETRIGAMAGVAFLVGATIVCAQKAAPPTPPDGPAILMAQGTEPEIGPPPGGPIEIVAFGAGGRGRKVVTGAPFSAIATSETVQTLADGNTIDRKSQTNLYRDSQGRFRKEETIKGFGPLAASAEGRTFIMIFDPVAGKTYVLNPAEKVAHEIASRGPAGRPGPGPLGQKLMIGKGPEGGVTTEDLGTQVFEGISAQGQRTTRTIPAGQLGNAKPIVITFESWYSPELQTVVMSKRIDPRFGTTTYTLTNIQRNEPDAGLFTVPPNYSIQQGHGPRGMRKGAPAAPAAPAAPPIE